MIENTGHTAFLAQRLLLLTREPPVFPAFTMILPDTLSRKSGQVPELLID